MTTNLVDDLIHLASMLSRENLDQPLTVEQAVGILEVLPAVRDRLTSSIIRAQQSLLNRLLADEAVDGYEVVEQFGQRKWLDPEAALQALAAMGMPMFECMSIKSPAQVEKILPKSVVEDLTTRESTTVLRRINE